MWTSNFLSNRFKRGNGELYYKSSLLPMSSGVPQGSVLGPYLFFVYVNDIDKDLPFSQNKFFLQIMLFICFSQNAIQKDLSTLVKLAKQWKMVLNVEKCQAVNFKDGLNRVSCDYKIANV